MFFMGVWVWVALPVLAFAVSDLVASGRSSLGIVWVLLSGLWLVLYKVIGPIND